MSRQSSRSARWPGQPADRRFGQAGASATRRHRTLRRGCRPIWTATSRWAPGDPVQPRGCSQWLNSDSRNPQIAQTHGQYLGFGGSGQLVRPAARQSKTASGSYGPRNSVTLIKIGFMTADALHPQLGITAVRRFSHDHWQNCRSARCGRVSSMIVIEVGSGRVTRPPSHTERRPYAQWLAPAFVAERSLRLASVAARSR